MRLQEQVGCLKNGYVAVGGHKDSLEQTVFKGTLRIWCGSCRDNLLRSLTSQLSERGSLAPSVGSS